MKTTETLQEATRHINNFARIPIWNTTADKDVVEMVFNLTGGTVFCNGHLRTIVSKPITDNMFKLETKPFE